MKESEIEKYFRSEVIKRGGFTRKYTSPGHHGVPDRIMFLNGVVQFVELKKPGGELSPMQIREIKRMHAQGAVVMVLNSKEEIDEFFSNYDQTLSDAMSRLGDGESGVPELHKPKD